MRGVYQDPRRWTINPHQERKDKGFCWLKLLHVTLLTLHLGGLSDVEQLIVVGICKQKHSIRKYNTSMTWNHWHTGKHVDNYFANLNHYILHCTWMGSLMNYNWFWIFANTKAPLQCTGFKFELDFEQACVARSFADFNCYMSTYTAFERRALWRKTIDCR